MSHDAEWDVIVCGAGPAGAAAALRVLRDRPAARVLLLDRADFPRDKTCGDGIAPHALDVLAGLGVTGVVDGYPAVPRLRLRAPGGPAVARTMTRPAHVVPRAVFDARLVAAALDRGAVLARHVVRRLEVGPDRVVVDGRYAGRAVVGADGANSVVRRQLGLAPNRGAHLAVALRGYAPTAGEADGAEQVIVMSGTDWPAYAWSFPIGDGRRNVGYGQVIRAAPASRAHLQARMRELLPDLPGTGEVAELRAHHLPLSSSRPRQPDGRVLLAGDAQSLINPFTGEGIFYAVLSGSAAGAAALAGAAAGATYRRELAALLGRHVRHTTLAAVLGRRPAVVDAGVRAARADQRVFDDLVELGLGRGLLTGTTLVALARHLAPARPRR